ncbi:unnamed protein product, partial [Allacma fusca]
FCEIPALRYGRINEELDLKSGRDVHGVKYGGIAAGTTPQIVDDERNTAKMLKEIWSEIHSIKSELSERKDAEANNFTSLESNGTQFTLNSRQQVCDAIFPTDIEEPDVASNEVINEPWVQDLMKLKSRLPAPVIGFTMTEKAMKNLVDANSAILKGSIILSNYTQSELIFGMNTHSGGLQPELIPGQTKEIIRYRIATVYFPGSPIKDGFYYKIGSTGMQLYVIVVLPAQGTIGLCCSILLTKKPVSINLGTMEHIPSSESFSDMEHKTFKVQAGDPIGMRKLKPPGHIVVECDNLTAMAKLTLKEDGSGVQVEIDLMPCIPESISTKPRSGKAYRPNKKYT